jgi:glycine/sarcosine N-methyltransferase
MAGTRDYTRLTRKYMSVWAFGTLASARQAWDDWESPSFFQLVRPMRREDEILRLLLPDPTNCGTVLDCASGIGTQAVALATLGYSVEGSDSSEFSIRHAQQNAERRGLSIPFRVDDVRDLRTAPDQHYGAVIALDNVLPHLGTESGIRTAIAAMHSRLRTGGMLLTGIRDYDPVLPSHPTIMTPNFSGNGSGRRIFHEVWDWHDERRYTCHVYVTTEVGRNWQVKHFTGEYCAILKCEMADLLRDAGFGDVQVLSPEQSGFHQPLILGKKH